MTSLSAVDSDSNPLPELLNSITFALRHCHSTFWSLFFEVFFSSQSLPVAVVESVFCIPLFKSLMTMLNKTRASRHTSLQGEVGSLFVSAASQPALICLIIIISLNTAVMPLNIKSCIVQLYQESVKVGNFTFFDFWECYVGCFDSGWFSMRNPSECMVVSCCLSCVC